MTPRVSPARQLARTVLVRVEKDGAYASLALASALATTALAPSDRGLVTELVYGVLRRRSRLERALGALSKRRGLAKLSPQVRVTLCIAAYEILFLRTPEHAAVNEAVAAIKEIAGEKVSGFANAVLRKLVQHGEPAPPPVTDVLSTLEEIHCLPRWLGEILRNELGDPEALAAAEAFNDTPPLTLRVSLDRTDREAVMAAIAKERPQARLEPASSLAEGLFVRGAGAPDALSVFRDGLVTVQDLAAQAVGRLVDVRPGQKVLDACAGVGGKSTHLQQLARAQGGEIQIDAVDLSEQKLALAQAAAERLGLRGIRTHMADLTQVLPVAGPYDRVLLDAPCSGLGVLRRHPEAKWRRRPRDVTTLAALQWRMLCALRSLVAPGGALVYSVCTFTLQEGTQLIERFIEENPDFSVDPVAETLADFGDADGFMRSWPHRNNSDAFFAARLKRAP